jgi:ABC-type Zn uptake system ZnuABC Zn-binding protein ZnuA
MNSLNCRVCFFCISIFLIFAGLAPLPADAKLNVVASIPDLADIAAQVGGNRVTVASIAKGYQDPHFVEPKPSFMLLLRKADLYLVSGMSLEEGWSPPLEQGSRNSAIVRGGAGYVDCSEGIQPLEIPAGGADRSMGDVHPEGNPHYLLDPQNGIIVAKTIAAALSRKDPANRAEYRQNCESFIQKVRRREARWLQKMKPLKGLKVITDHRMWSYFARRFGLDVVSCVEPKPGISPSPAHVAALIKLMKQEKIMLILRTPYFDEKIPNLIARNTGAKSIVLPNSVGAVDGAGGYLELFDCITDRLAAAAGKEKGE